MEFTHAIQNEVLIVTLQGENLDAVALPSFKDKIFELINQSNFKKVILDLGQIKFIDSAGLGTLLSLQKALNKQGGKLKLTNLTKSVQSMFEMVSMQRLFEISPTVEDALKSF